MSSCATGYQIEAVVYMIISAVAIVYFSIATYRQKSEEKDAEHESFGHKFKRAGIIGGVLSLIMSVDSQGALNIYPWIVIPMLRDIWTMFSLYHGSLYIVLNMQLSRLRMDEYSLAQFMFRFSTLPILILFVLWCATSIPSFVLDSSQFRGIYTIFLSIYLFLGSAVMLRVLIFIAKTFIEKHQISQLHQKGTKSRSNSVDSNHSARSNMSSNLSKSEVRVLAKLAVIFLCSFGMIAQAISATFDFLGRPSKLSLKIHGSRCEKYVFFQFLVITFVFLLVLFVYSYFGIKDSPGKTRSATHSMQKNEPVSPKVNEINTNVVAKFSRKESTTDTNVPVL